MSSKLAEAKKIVGILPDWAIYEYLKAQIIKIDPLPAHWDELINPVSIDFRLGHNLRIFSSDGLDTIDTKYTTREEVERMMPLIKLKDNQPLVLTKNKFVIATTLEKLTLPNNIIGHLHGKSSLARLGVVVHSTAARFDPGWDGYPVLELGVLLENKEIVLYQGHPICAFSFEQLASATNSSYYDKSLRKYGDIVPGVAIPENTKE